jgi:AMMECR1 domain-containing protein
MVMHGHRKGLLLPQVGRRTGMTRELFLEALSKKAQISTTALQEPDTALYAFTAEVIENREYGSQHV